MPEFDLTGGRRGRGALTSDRRAATALRKSGQTLAVTVKDEMSDAAKAYYVIARSTLESAPGRYPKSRTQIIISGDTVALHAPWAPGAEWGSNTHHVFGRKTTDEWGIWPARKTGSGGDRRPDVDSGYILGAAMRFYGDQIDELVANNVLDHYSDDLDQQGVPRVGGI